MTLKGTMSGQRRTREDQPVTSPPVAQFLLIEATWEFLSNLDAGAASELAGGGHLPDAAQPDDYSQLIRLVPAGVASAAESWLRRHEAMRQMTLTPELHRSNEKLFQAGTEDKMKLAIIDLDDRLIDALAVKPELVHGLSPRRFEELVAALFLRMGYAVSLTPRIRDGGRDVVAIRDSESGWQKTVIECKKFRLDRKVGVAAVRSLYGVVAAENATDGLIVTTSSFTRGAREFEQQVAFKVSLRDGRDLAAYAARCQSP